MNPKVQEALDAGYTQDEIDVFLKNKEQKTTPNLPTSMPQEATPSGLAPEIARKAAIGSLGLAKGAAFPYDIAAEVTNLALRERPTGGLVGMAIGPEEQPLVPEITPGAGILEGVPPEIPEEKEPYFQFPTTSDLIKNFGKLIGVDLEPKDAVEEALDLLGFVRAAKKGAQKALTSFSTRERAYELGKDIVTDTVLTSTAVGVKEAFGTPEWATLLAGGVFVPTVATAGKLAKEIGKKGYKAFGEVGEKYFLFDPRNIFKRDPVSAIEQEIQQAKDMAKEQFESGVMSKERYDVVKPYLEIAEKYNIPVNVGSFTDSDHFKNIERLLSENPMSQSAKNEFLQKSAEQWANSMYDLTSKISTTKLFSEKNSVAEALFNDVTKKKHQQLKDESSSLYTASEKLFEDAHPISKEDREKLIQSFNGVINSLNKTLVETPVEGSTKSIAEKVVDILNEKKKTFHLIEGHKIEFEKNITPENLVATLRSLNDVTLWDQPSVKNLLKKPRKLVKDVLKKYEKDYPKAYEAYTRANEKHAEMSNLFGQGKKWEKWNIYADSTPEQLLNQINSVSRWKEFQKDFGQSTQGNLLINELRRLKAEEKLAPIFEQIEYNPGTISRNMQRLFRDPMFNQMITPEVKKDLNSLADLDKFIAREGGKSFYKYQTGKPDQIEKTVQQLKFLSPSYWAIKLSDVFQKNQISKAYTDIMLNPNITSEMKRLGDEGKKAIKAKDTDWMNRVDAEIKSFWNILEENIKLTTKAAAARKEAQELESELTNIYSSSSGE